MKRDDVKALTASTAAFAATALGIPPAATPVVRSGIARLFDVANASHEAKVNRLLEHAIADGDDEAFTARVAQAYARGESEVVAGFEQAVRSAVFTVDPVVLESMGLLLRRVVQPSLTPFLSGVPDAI